MTTKTKTKKVVKEERLDPRWLEFMDLYILTGNAKQSALDVGFSENYADKITTRFPEKVVRTLTEAMERKGIDSEALAEKVNVLLNAERAIYKNNNKTGRVEKVGIQPDYQAIDKGITHAVKVRGDYSPEKHQSLNLNVEVKGKDKELEKLRKDYVEGIKKLSGK